MSSIPSNLARVSTLLSSNITTSTLGRTNQQLLELQAQLASGQRVNRASDDALATSAITLLDDSIERHDQRLRNLSHADSVLNNVDAAIADATELLIEVKGIALSQIGVGSDATTRETQAAVIDAFITEMVNIANRQYQDLYFFGGNATADAPIENLLGGLQYTGQGDGLVTDLGLSRSITITASGEDVFGALSARVEGERDLDPGVVGDTRLVDLAGAGGLGVRLSTVNVDIGGTDVEIDLSTADSIQDVADLLTAGIQAVDPGASVQIDPAASRALEVTTSGGAAITITDVGGGSAAADLGIDTTFSAGASTDGADLNAFVTPLTALASLTGLTLPLGTIRLENAGQTRDLDLSSAQSVQDVINAVEALNIGIRVEISETRDRLNFVNELSGGDMSVGEFSGGSTATELGVRSFARSTLLSDFNGGLGVEIIEGSVDPVTGTPDPAADLDFRVTVKDGRSFDVDLAGALTVDDVLDEINAAAAAAGLANPADFFASLAGTGNGIVLGDNTVGTTTSVTALNGSHAAENLGILGTETGAILSGDDRATVAVDSVFSHLIALRDALRANDERGISIAAGDLEADVTRLARARGEVGVASRRVADAVEREEDLRVQDISLRSEVRDLDFTEAAIRFATLQQQLQAGLTTAGQVSQLSLLDFLR